MATSMTRYDVVLTREKKPGQVEEVHQFHELAAATSCYRKLNADLYPAVIELLSVDLDNGCNTTRSLMRDENQARLCRLGSNCCMM